MKKVSILLCLLWIGFIFYMSGNNGQVSHEQSIKVTNAIENAQSKLETKLENKTINQRTQGDKNIANKQTAKENQLDHIVRKNAHAFMYAVLALLVSSALFASNKRGGEAIVYIMFICLFYAVLDEFHQSFIPGRTSLVSDVLVDFGGAAIGLIVFYLCYYKVYKKYLIIKKINRTC